MPVLFTIFGIISFVMFAYAVYAQSKQIEQLKKVVRRQRNLIDSSSTLTPREQERIEQRLEEDWDDIEKLF